MPSDLQITLNCVCGRSLIAHAKDAGADLVCTCGRTVSVPRLSEMRSLTGNDAYVTNPVEAIRKAQRNGQDPAGTTCLICGSNVPIFYKFRANCERSHVAKVGNEGESSILRWIFLPVILNFIIELCKKKTETERRGHDIELLFNLPICEPCTKTIGNVRRAKIAKQVMSRVTLFRELLEYYPNLELRIE